MCSFKRKHKPIYRRKKQKEEGKKRVRKYLIPFTGENHHETKGGKRMDFKKQHDIMGDLRKGERLFTSLLLMGWKRLPEQIPHALEERL